MARYQVGDVVLCWVAWENPDGSFDSKCRHSIVYRVDGDQERLILAGYGKDRTGKVKGLRIEANSKEGKEMRLQKDTFFNCENPKEVFFRDIERKIGTARLVMDQIDDIMEDLGL
ncbi:hypothetical protein N7E81_11590 [Reichenbachiella carrageenanivorans]|uniref:PemK-like, MazF-like toxin of type II toxin-antitoxin system n=1 Tax=Reichenbachiella carrageenanivorans TaxID=2979869 RepID=A0ABY6CYY6_9BACT|nr:hypothetical protein [Reichenbachiella carrageenanivorans]UXX78003.1 hypothetical protein N7E81_11590 [Reichenbachiella carrageenanivorans]